jgi:predicted signal transduction protein with EAL and GGDEF domain
LRPEDTLARVGGDEFAVLIEGADAATRSVSVAEAIIEALSRPVSLGKGDVFTGCSIGIAHAAGHYTKPEELLRDADIAMYAAKKHGGKGFATYNADMHAGAVEAFRLQTDLQHAIARSEFRLEYQPIYNATSGKLIAFEALVRWHHPERGLVGPDVFIPIAEEMGIIHEIDRWVMRESCDQMHRWEARCPELDVRLSINVSGGDLRHSGFIAELRSTLAEFGLEGSRLQLEITESVFLRRPEIIGQVLADIRALGVRIALDDFGTGYSSLGYLDRYQFDTLKIDRSFVVRMLRQERAMAIMEGIVRLGSALRLDIVAEGVETGAQLAMLRSLGCANVQGYLLGRPMAAPDVIALLCQAGTHPLPALASLEPAA